MMTALFTCDRFQDFFCRGKTIPLQTDCQEELLSSQSRPGKSKQNVDEEGRNNEDSFLTGLSGL